MAPHVLIAHPSPPTRRELAAWLERAGFTSVGVESGEEALERGRSGQVDAVLLAVELPGRSGLDVLAHLAELDAGPAVVLVGEAPDASTALSALRRGAADYLEEPLSPEGVRDALARALPDRAVRRERDHLRRRTQELYAGPVVSSSAGMRRVLEHVDRAAAAASTTALVVGEPGVGKKLVARAIHDRSARRGRAFVTVHCAALSDAQLEAELFGYEAGAFAGGVPEGHGGLAAAADGGTLFLEEVGALTPPLQAKLLRLLRERAYRPVGASSDRRLDARVVASTDRDLEELVEAGRFRADLLYRLNVLTLSVPPLRERKADVLPLAEQLRKAIAAQLGKNVGGFGEAARARLCEHDWPGNARELHNAIERAVLLAPPEALIDPEHLSLHTDRSTPEAPSDPLAPLHIDALSLQSVERALIERVLHETGGNRSHAARILGVNRTTLYNKLRVFANA